jgi:hypothetical protein
MDVAAGFDVTRTSTAVVVSLVRLQKDIFSSDFNTPGQSKQTRRAVSINHL